VSRAAVPRECDDKMVITPRRRDSDAVARSAETAAVSGADDTAMGPKPPRRAVAATERPGKC